MKDQWLLPALAQAPTPQGQNLELLQQRLGAAARKPTGLDPRQLLRHLLERHLQQQQAVITGGPPAGRRLTAMKQPQQQLQGEADAQVSRRGVALAVAGTRATTKGHGTTTIALDQGEGDEKR